jgi:hypothetical protein
LHVLERGIPLSSLDSKEIHYISQYNTFRNGYNGTRGGGGIGSRSNKPSVESGINKPNVRSNVNKPQIGSTIETNNNTPKNTPFYEDSGFWGMCCCGSIIIMFLLGLLFGH